MCRRSSVNRAGFVYFIQEAELFRIKIGFTTSHPYTRMKTLANASSQALSFIGLQIGSELLEKKLHARFKHLHRRNEWFDAGQDLLDYIKALDYADEFERELSAHVKLTGIGLGAKYK